MSFTLRVGKIRVFYCLEGLDLAMLRVLAKKDAEKHISKLD